MSAEAIWILAERPSGEHLPQLYSHETVLIESLRMFTTHGLSRGEAVLLVLTPSHRGLLLEHLKAEGVDVDGLRRTGQLLLLDAAELLASFTLDGMPDATLFRLRLGDIVASMRPSGSTRKVRVFVYWNEGAEQLYGYAPDEVIGQPGAVLMPPGHNELPAVIEGICRGELVPHYHTRRRRKDGTVIDVSVAVSPIRTRDNELVGVSVVARDISERKRAEEALARLAAIVDSSEDAIIGKTLDTTIISHQLEP
jgi:PAS domain S-box-containing protein